ncbi:GGDEF domain-containing protein [Mycolicibacterium sp. CH28]|uniref:sensor domain-containing diguanylate cyclase n=1 Tax=Mycolicibacterium sp. CH28 TaxID=2512237 RepID=UPI001080961C|nr:GGDEF domain-containing protein [Mycolicibacterium sp. CH28]TGD86753.1 GGDEF domain-containing protein [Mycolicibacterium sp. CH28]
MVSAEQWLATLSAAGVPAFHCHRAAGELTIVARTPEFMGVMQKLSGRFDEQSLLARLNDQWPSTVSAAPLTIAATGEPAWRCIIRAVDAEPDGYLAILRLPEEWQSPNDAFFTIVESLPDVVTRYSRDFRCLYANSALGAITGVPAETRFGKTYAEIGAPAEYAANFEAVYQRVIDTGEPVEIGFDYPGPGGVRHYLGRATPEFDSAGRVDSILSVVRDISEVRRLQHRLEQLARTDPLTGLPNRRSFSTRLDLELDRVRRGQGGLSLLLLDLDNFKNVNDRFGHVAGDRVLETVGRILAEETRPHDITARLGGDEFCVALLDIDTTSAHVVARRIGRRVSGITAEDGRPLGISVSVGVTVAEEKDGTAQDLLSRADLLMYKVKSGGAD